MELLIYYSYSEFIKNYENDFSAFKEIFTDANESDFIDDRKNLYRIAIENVTLIENYEFSLIDTETRLFGINIITEIENKIYNSEMQEFDFILIKKYLYTFNKILNFLDTKPLEKQTNSNVGKTTEKININGNTQLLGHIFIQLIEGGFIEPIKTGNGEINKMATARMLLEHFNFTEKEHQPTVEYLKKAIFENQFSAGKTEYLKISPLKNFN